MLDIGLRGLAPFWLSWLHNASLPANRLFKCDQRSNEFPESMRLDFKHGQERNQLSEVNGQLLILDLRHRRPGADRFVGAFCVAHLLSNGFDEKVRSWHAGGKRCIRPSLLLCWKAAKTISETIFPN